MGASGGEAGGDEADIEKDKEHIEREQREVARESAAMHQQLDSFEASKEGQRWCMHVSVSVCEGGR